MDTPLLSIISPVYKAENIVDELVKRIVQEVSKITDHFEIILVEDGSPDNSWKKIVENCSKDKRVVGLKLSRNFGQHFAITAGIHNSNGQYIVIMDCDLQDDPVNIIDLYNKSKEGFDIVFTKRLSRQHPFIKNLGSKLYYYILNYLSDGKYSLDTGSMVLFSKTVKENLVKLKEHERLYIQMLKWVGFNSTVITVEHKKRFEGKSSYTFTKIVKLGFSGIVAHSDKLLTLSISVGFILSLTSLLSITVVVLLYFFQGFQSGWASLICMILMSTGLILMSSGILGLYLGKVYNQVKERPLFIVQKGLNTTENHNIHS